MMENESLINTLNLDGKLPHLTEVTEQQNLLKNYSSLKNTTNIIKCRIAEDYKCQVIKTSEVSRALNNYLEKMSSIGQIKDEKLLKVCQEIEKLHDTTNTEQNCKIKTSDCTSVNGVAFEKDMFQNNEKIDSSFCVQNSTEGSSSLTNDEVVTVDDFLVRQEKNHDSEKLQTHEIAQNELLTQQNTTEEHFAWSEKQDTEEQEKRSSLVSNEKIVTSSETSKERPFACSKCPMTFKRNLHLKRHFIVTHTPNKNFKCQTCGKLFSRKDYLDKHTNGHQKKDLKIKLLEQGIVVRTKIFSKSGK